MTWDDLLAHPRRRDVHGVLTVLEEVDDDTGTAVYRRAGHSHTVQRPEKTKVPGTFKFAAAGVAAAGIAWLATRRRV